MEGFNGRKKMRSKMFYVFMSTNGAGNKKRRGQKE